MVSSDIDHLEGMAIVWRMWTGVKAIEGEEESMPYHENLSHMEATPASADFSCIL